MFLSSRETPIKSILNSLTFYPDRGLYLPPLGYCWICNKLTTAIRSYHQQVVSASPRPYIKTAVSHGLEIGVRNQKDSLRASWKELRQVWLIIQVTDSLSQASKWYSLVKCQISETVCRVPGLFPEADDFIKANLTQEPVEQKIIIYNSKNW